MSPQRAFLDTSFVLALENRDDPLHERAKQLDRELMAAGSTLVLHWGILLELGDGYARIGRRTKAFQLFEKLTQEEVYAVYPLSASLLEAAIALYCSRPDKEWGLTDCISFTLMSQENVTEALTADAHFRQAGFKAMLLAQ